MHQKTKWPSSLAALTIALLFVRELRADEIANFYQGRTIRLVIGYGEGGGYDVYGRLAAEFLGRHIPGNPTIIPQNLPGAGSFKAVDYLANAAPGDGTYLGTVAQTLAMDAIVDEQNTIDVTRLPYIGRITTNIDIGVAMPTTGIKSFVDARNREIIVGVSGGGSTSVVYPLALNAYAGAKFKLVRGYKGTAEIEMAAERGEVDVNPAVGIPGILTSHPEWILEHKAVILYQNALTRFQLLPEVPTLPELATTDEGRAVMRTIAGTAEIGRSILTTPGVPPQRLAALRKAFQEMLADPDFLAACKKRNLMLDPGTGEAMDAITQETMHLPKPIIESVRALMKG
jgi:tripartite-type tricarboxylate transporter receptor subunit TctC